MKSRNAVLSLFTLGCFALCPVAQAVSPPPDGGYPGFNTAEGQNALFNLSTGLANTAVGWFSLFSNTDGSFNTAVGAGTLLFNVGDQGESEGVENTAVGTAALLFNATGARNTAVGTSALSNNTEGSGNSALGSGALVRNTTGESNTAIGRNALLSNISGFGNTAIAAGALNVSTNGSFNTVLGFGAGGLVNTANNVICIGANVPGENVDNSCYIGKIHGQSSPSGTAVFVNEDGKLGTSTSSRRFKEEIEPMGKASDALLALQPVKFRYKKDFDRSGAAQFGLVAEEVEKINPDLIVHDKDGRPYSVRYEAVNAMLLNEFLKEHRKVEKLEATVASLMATVKDQAAQIQKVSAQLEVSKPAAQVVSHGQ